MLVPPATLNAIGKIKFIKLTHRGIIELLKYTPEVIEEVAGKASYMPKAVKNKFKWLCKECDKFGSKTEDIILYERCKRAAKKHGSWSDETHEDLKIEGQRDIFKKDVDPKEEFNRAAKSPNLTPEAVEFLKGVKVRKKEIIW